MDVDRVAQLVAEGLMPLIRTDFSSDEAWQRVLADVSSTSDFLGDGDGYTPNVEPVSDVGFASATTETLATAWPKQHHGYVMLADERSIGEAAAGGEVTVVFLDLSADAQDEEEFGWVFGRAFRSVASEVAGIEANLSIANMDFADFADSVGGDGVFGGF